MNEELIKLLLGVAAIVITVLIMYIRSGSRKSLYNFILSGLINFWDKVVKLLFIVAIIWFSIRLAAYFLRRIL
ncbi:hypothetical protein U472_07700 [Orenia metallireducens]|jgi:hypothetical protein|uniref:Uncharacterized protein n=1 Tax=Orenia metallireducens TaxID=1413210 RepID=A0A1C0AAN4_9FIRM|nr:hypothetical protein [Orenia metallireducens]OCL27335.1 hypothetical protein U472_07700 [Orenia metallireducens]